MVGKLFIVSAPSGTGKTTLVNALLERLQNRCRLERVVTYTTKSPSVQEKNGQDYHFVSQADFEAKVQEGFFMEWSGAYGSYYGSPSSILAQLEKGVSFILVIDRVGAQKLIAAGHNPVLIWIKPTSLEVLRERLELRGRDAAAVIERRLALAQEELAEEKSNSLYKHHVINEDFNEALKNLEHIFLAELTPVGSSISASEATIERL
jgi:guanylate kinase